MSVDYTKIGWVNRIVQRPRTYTETTNADGSIAHTPAPGEVVQEGTPRSAENMDHMDQGIKDCADAINDALGSIATMQTTVAECNTRVGNAERSISAIQAVDETQSGNIAAVTQAHNALAGDVEELESGYNAHVNNFSNPHRVTKQQIGLGNVSNVTTNNLAPTFTEATSNLALESGSTLSTLLGRIARAVRMFYAHITSSANPHSVTLRQAAGFVVGTYIGNAGVTDNTADGLKQTINLGFTPMRVMVFYPMIGGVSNANVSTHGNMSSSRTYYFDVVYNVYCADCGDMGDRATVKPSELFNKRHGGGSVIPNGFSVASSYVDQYSEKYPNLNSYNMRYVYVAWLPQSGESIPDYIKDN